MLGESEVVLSCRRIGGARQGEMASASEPSRRTPRGRVRATGVPTIRPPPPPPPSKWPARRTGIRRPWTLLAAAGGAQIQLSGTTIHLVIY